MSDTLFHHYIIGAGWTIIILIPASIVALATVVRVGARLWGRSPHQLADDLQKTVSAQSSRAPLSLTDARTIAADFAMSIHAAMQPLSIIYAAAPVLGALGSAWKLSAAWRGPDSMREENLRAALEQAFIPLDWGLGVALLAITGYAVLRARLFRVERDIFAPAAITALNEAKGPRERKG